jgi:hypothetical protein
VAYCVLNEETLMPRIKGGNCYICVGGNAGTLNLSILTGSYPTSGLPVFG